jgi:hypothetical protein
VTEETVLDDPDSEDSTEPEEVLEVEVDDDPEADEAEDDPAVDETEDELEVVEVVTPSDPVV